MMTSTPPPLDWLSTVYVMVDPAAGGPQSDFAVMSFVRQRGVMIVSAPCSFPSGFHQLRMYSLCTSRTNSLAFTCSSLSHLGMISFFSSVTNRTALWGSITLKLWELVLSTQ